MDRVLCAISYLKERRASGQGYPGVVRNDAGTLCSVDKFLATDQGKPVFVGRTWVERDDAVDHVILGHALDVIAEALTSVQPAADSTQLAACNRTMQALRRIVVGDEDQMNPLSFYAPTETQQTPPLIRRRSPDLLRRLVAAAVRLAQPGSNDNAQSALALSTTMLHCAAQISAENDCTAGNFAGQLQTAIRLLGSKLSPDNQIEIITWASEAKPLLCRDEAIHLKLLFQGAFPGLLLANIDTQILVFRLFLAFTCRRITSISLSPQDSNFERLDCAVEASGNLGNECSNDWTSELGENITVSECASAFSSVVLATRRGQTNYSGSEEEKLGESSIFGSLFLDNSYQARTKAEPSTRSTAQLQKLVSLALRSLSEVVKAARLSVAESTAQCLAPVVDMGLSSFPEQSNADFNHLLLDIRQNEAVAAQIARKISKLPTFPWRLSREAATLLFSCQGIVPRIANVVVEAAAKTVLHVQSSMESVLLVSWGLSTADNTAKNQVTSQLLIRSKDLWGNLFGDKFLNDSFISLLALSAVQATCSHTAKQFPFLRMLGSSMDEYLLYILSSLPPVDTRHVPDEVALLGGRLLNDIVDRLIPKLTSSPLSVQSLETLWQLVQSSNHLKFEDNSFTALALNMEAKPLMYIIPELVDTQNTRPIRNRLLEAEIRRSVDSTQSVIFDAVHEIVTTSHSSFQLYDCIESCTTIGSGGLIQEVICNLNLHLPQSQRWCHSLMAKAQSETMLEDTRSKALEIAALVQARDFYLYRRCLTLVGPGSDHEKAVEGKRLSLMSHKGSSEELRRWIVFPPGNPEDLSVRIFVLLLERVAERDSLYIRDWLLELSRLLEEKDQWKVLLKSALSSQATIYQHWISLADCGPVLVRILSSIGPLDPSRDAGWSDLACKWTCALLSDIENETDVEQFFCQIQAGCTMAGLTEVPGHVSMVLKALADGFSSLAEPLMSGSLWEPRLLKAKLLYRCLIILVRLRTEAPVYNQVWPESLHVLGKMNDEDSHNAEEEHRQGEIEAEDTPEESGESKSCTFVSTGNQFVEQHWYFCYSCNLTASEGICSVCAQLCHKGHQVAYSRLSRFFCDCGAAAVAAATALESGEQTGVSHSCEALKPLQTTESDLDQSHLRKRILLLNSKILSDCDDRIGSLLRQDGALEPVAKLACLISDYVVPQSSILTGLRGLTLHSSQKVKHAFVPEQSDEPTMILPGHTGWLNNLWKAGTLSTSKVSSQVNKARRVAFDRKTTVALIDRTKVILVDVSPCLDWVRPNEALAGDSLHVLSQQDYQRPLSFVEFHPSLQHLLLVAGESSFELIDTRAPNTKSVVVNFRIEETDEEVRGNGLVDVRWITGPNLMVAVALSGSLKVFKPLTDPLIPSLILQMNEGERLVAMVSGALHSSPFVAVATNQNSVILLALGKIPAGFLERSQQLEFNIPVLNETVQAMSYIPWLQSIVVNFGSGATLFGRLNLPKRSLTWTNIYHGIPARDILVSWDAPGHVVSVCSDNTSMNSVRVEGKTLLSASFPPRSLHSDTNGILGAAFCDVSPLVPFVLVFKLDGSVNRLDLSLSGERLLPPRESSATREADDDKTEEVSDDNEELCSVGLFEKSRPVSQDQLRFGDDETTNRTFQGGQCWVSPTSDEPQRIRVHHSGRDVVLVGARALFGGCDRSITRMPSEIRVFDRPVPVELVAGSKRWVDIAFTRKESQSSRDSFMIELIPPRDGLGDGHVAIDSLETYSMSSAEFTEHCIKSNSLRPRRQKKLISSKARISAGEAEAVAGLQMLEVSKLPSLEMAELYFDSSDDGWPNIRAWCDRNGKIAEEAWSTALHQVGTRLITKTFSTAEDGIRPVDLDHAAFIAATILRDTPADREMALALLANFLEMGSAGWEYFTDRHIVCKHLVSALWNSGNRESIPQLLLLDHTPCASSCSMALIDLLKSNPDSQPIEQKSGSQAAKCPNCDDLGCRLMQCTHCNELLCRTCAKSERNHDESHFFVTARSELSDVHEDFDWLATETREIWEDPSRGYELVHLAETLCSTTASPKQIDHLERNGYFKRLQSPEFGMSNDAKKIEKDIIVLGSLAQISEVAHEDSMSFLIFSSLVSILRRLVNAIEGTIGKLRESPAGILRGSFPGTTIIPEGYETIQDVDKVEIYFVLVELSVRILERSLSTMAGGQNSTIMRTLVDDLFALLFLQSNISVASSCPRIGYLYSSFRLAKKLLLTTFEGSKVDYNAKLDDVFLTKQMTEVSSITSRCKNLTYDEQCRLSSALGAMVLIMEKRPWNWIQFCSLRLKDEADLQLLCKIGQRFSDPIQTASFRLLAVSYAGNVEFAITAISATGNNCESRLRKEQYALTNPPTASANFLLKQNMKVLKTLIENFLLRSGRRSVRLAVYYLVRGIMTMVKERGQPGLLEELQEVFLRASARMSSLGLLSEQFAQLLSDSMREMGDGKYCSDLARSLLGSFRQASEFLSSHPNSHIYRALRRRISIDGYFLESEPCQSCASSLGIDQCAFEHRLESLRLETKYTDCAIMHRLISPQAISRVVVKVSESRRARRPRQVNLWYSNRLVNEASELKSPSHPWKKLKHIPLPFDQQQGHVDFALAVVATNLMIEFADFYGADDQRTPDSTRADRLQCPRCSRPVSDRHGICRNCRENAYQCRQCRNINYDNLDAFLCNECGYCKHGRFEFLVTSSASFSSEPILTEMDRRRAADMIDKGTKIVHRRYEDIKTMRQSILDMLGSVEPISIECHESNDEAQLGRDDLGDAAGFFFGSLSGQRRSSGTASEQESDSGERPNALQSPRSRVAMESVPETDLGNLVTRRTVALAVTYGRECKSLFVSLNFGLQSLRGMRNELAKYATSSGIRSQADSESESPGVSEVTCFGCAQGFVGHSLRLLELLVRTKPEARQSLLEDGLCLDLLRNFHVHEHRRDTPQLVMSIICELVSGNSFATQQICDEIAQKLEFCVENWDAIEVEEVSRAHIMIIDAMMKIEDHCWERRLKMVLKVLFFAASRSSSSPGIAERIVLPCVTAAVQLARGEGDDEATLPEDVIISTGVADDACPHVEFEEWINGKQTFESWSAEVNLEKSSGPCQADPNFSANYETVEKYSGWSWLIQLLIMSPTSAVRSQVSFLLEILYHDDGQQKDVKTKSLLDILTQAPLALATSRGERAREYFDLVGRVARPTKYRAYLGSNGFLHRAAFLIEKECRDLEEAEAKGIGFLNLSRGFCVNRLADLFSQTLRALKEERLDKWIEDAKSLVGGIVRSFLVVQRLVTQQTKQTDEAKETLLQSLRSDDCLGDRPEVLESYLEELMAAEQTKDRPTVVILLEQLCGILSPEKPEPSYELVLNKAPTQEEFIRGSMSRSSYDSSSIGLLMRDVKNKICRDLELTGLIEDDFGMELLVAGNLIKLDLTIRSVYENVWRAHEGPMVLVYRLSGLDGEATEPIIDHLPESAEEVMDPEDEFQNTAALGQAGGLKVLLNLLEDVPMWSDTNSQIWSPALRLLRACCSIKSNRRILAATGEPVAILLDCAAKAFLCDLPGAGRAAESLLLASEVILAEVQVSVDRPADRGGDDEVLSRLQVFLERIETSTIKAETTLMRVLPFLTQGVEQAVDLLMSYFTERINLDKVDHSIACQRAMSQLTTVLEAAPKGPRGDRFRTALVDCGLAQHSIEEVSVYFPYPRKDFGEVWSQSLNLAGPPLILRLLRVWVEPLIGYSLFDRLDVGRLFFENIATLVSMETVASSGAVGSLSEELLEVLRGNVIIKNQVDEHRKSKREARKLAAANSRAAVLRESGMLDMSGSLASECGEMGSKQLSRARSLPPECLDLDEIVDEVGSSCVVCGDGFRSRPEEVLGVYVYCKRYSLPNGFSRMLGLASTGGTVFSSLSYFNGIHQVCHTEAFRMDRAMRVPRAEWDGATLRNSQTLCNNILPLRPPLALEASCGRDETTGAMEAASNYSTSVDLYFSRLNSMNRSTISKQRLVLTDLAFSLNRFSIGNSICFSEDTRGGGAFSNVCLLVHMIQLALFLGVSEFQEVLHHYLFDEGAKEDGGIYLAMSISLVTESYKTWTDRIPTYLSLALRESQPEAARSGDVEVYVTMGQPLILVAFVHQLQRFLKSGLPDEGQQCIAALQARICQDDTWLTEGTQALSDRYEAVTSNIATADDFLLLMATEVDAGGNAQEFRDSLLPTLSSHL